MKALKLSLRYLSFIGICSDRLYEPTNDFFKQVNCVVPLLGFFGPLLTFSAMYMIENITDLVLLTNAMIVFTGGQGSFIGYISIAFSMKNVKLLYRELQAIVDRGELQNDTFVFILFYSIVIIFCSSRNIFISILCGSRKERLQLHEKSDGFLCAEHHF